MKYIIQALVEGSDNSWFDFDDANEKDKAELPINWIRHYYKDGTFRLIQEGVDADVHNHPLGTGFAQKDKKGDK